MNQQAAARTIDERATLGFLMVGNIVIGAGVLAPSAMMNGLTAGLGVSEVEIGALIGWGAVVLCIGAPVLAFLTTRIDRRTLLTGCLLVYAVGHFVSALSTDYGALLAARLMMIAAAAVYTPQAASTVALIVSEDRRAGAVALVFMGWAIAGASVAPLLAIVAESVGWKAGFAGIGTAALLVAVGVAALTPGRLLPAAMSLRNWGAVLVRPAIIILLLTTMIQIAGQFTLFSYLAADVRRASGASPVGVSLALAAYGASGLAGSIFAARYVSRIGAAQMQIASLVLMALGLGLWAFTSPVYGLAVATCVIWGLGFGPGVAMQQARLMAVAPALASASVALNSSFLYFGQALGSTAGGVLISHDMDFWLGPVGATFMVVAIGLSVMAWRRFGV
ncbi:MFS transporter [bacterium]|nr:MFS transporter [bacterium]